MIRKLVLSMLFPVRLRVVDWRDRRTAEMRSAYARVLREARQVKRRASEPERRVRIERDAVPAWLMADVAMLRRQAE